MRETGTPRIFRGRATDHAARGVAGQWMNSMPTLLLRRQAMRGEKPFIAVYEPRRFRRAAI